MSYFAWLIFIAAAMLEVGGDAVIRRGLALNNLAFMAGGFLMLGCYGFVINLVKWDFSKLLGVYVAIFALVSILWGRFIFKETVPLSTWLGLAVIMVGGLIVQSGQR
jgi:drug/metabolite transporter superfamily protein YnfA